MEAITRSRLAELREAGVKRLGLMGGTFNPIHLGHLQMCLEAAQSCALDRVGLLVSGEPPHKPSGVISAEHRLKMAELAAENGERLVPLALEVERAGATYTVDTLRELKRELPETRLFYIIGSDTLFALDEWKNAREVRALTEFICFPRSDVEHRQLSARIRQDKPEYFDRVTIVNSPILPISSTEIRARVTQGLSVSAMLPAPVEGYIRENGLYTADALTFDEAAELLKARLKKSRFEHTLGVVKTAKELAAQNGAEVNAAAWAALLHDCAKQYGAAEEKALCAQFGVALDEYDEAAPQLIHAKLGAELAKRDYGMFDPAVLSAIACHTTGKRGMTTLDMIIYLADAIEPNRDYPSVGKLRAAAEKNLAKAALACMERSIEYIIHCEQTLHPDTVAARNELLEAVKNKQEVIK